MSDFPANNDGADPLTLSLPAGPIRLVFLPRKIILESFDPAGLEVPLSAPQLKPGEIVPMHVEARTLETRKIRLVGDCGNYELCVVDQTGQSQLNCTGSDLGRSIGARPKDVPIFSISRRTGQRKRLDLKDLPEDEVQTIDLP